MTPLRRRKRHAGGPTAGVVPRGVFGRESGPGRRGGPGGLTGFTASWMQLTKRLVD